MKIVEKGWGHEKWIHNDEKYCGKLLFFKAGKKCSLHYHKLKSETFYVQSGALCCIFSNGIEDEPFEMQVLYPGDVKEVPPYTRHQMLAIENTVMFEFSTQHFDEDSIRILKGD